MSRSLSLLLNVLIVSACGLVYELLAGTVASYVLGDSVTQFSLIIGIYLAALGLGAWLSRFISGNLGRRFIEIELAVALLGGYSAPLLFLSFAHFRFFQLALYLTVAAVGTFVGLEVPLLMRIIKDQFDFRELVSKVLTFDYAGSLLAAVIFPLLLVPRLGLVRTSLLFGLLNAGVALWASYIILPPEQPRPLRLRICGALVVVLLCGGLFQANRLTSLAEDGLYADDIIFARSTAYQRIVVTRGRAGFQIFLNGHLQFSSADEYRYHEALVHPALLLTGEPRRVLVLGGGDGLALREILKYPSVKEVTLVDIDPEMTGLSASFPPLAKLNQNSFSDPRVKVVNQDAMLWLQAPGEPFDAAIVDFPDPNSYALGKLYTTRFYRLLKSRLTEKATVAVQCTSPLFARQSYWCIIRTLEAAGFAVHPYQTQVPSFGVWGFALAACRPFETPTRVALKHQFLNDATLASLFVLSADIEPVAVEINRLDNQVLVRYYETDWRHWD